MAAPGLLAVMVMQSIKKAMAATASVVSVCPATQKQENNRVHSSKCQ